MSSGLPQRAEPYSTPELLDHLRSGCQTKDGGDLIYEVEREYIREV